MLYQFREYAIVPTMASKELSLPPASEGIVRVALAQLDYQPAASLSYAYLEEPALLDEGEQGITSLPLSLPGSDIIGRFRGEVAAEYERFMRARLVTILKTLNNLAVDLVVFPEYSIPANCLAVVEESAGDCSVVAGSHTVTQSSLTVLEQLGDSLGQDDLGKSVCPVRLFKHGWSHVDKLTRSKWEAALKPGSNWSPLTLTTRIGQHFTFAVLLCIDFLNDLDPNLQRLLPRDLWQSVDLGIVPSYSPTIRDFESRSRAILERLGKPLVYANVALLGGSQIVANFGEVGTFTDVSGSKRLAANEEAVLIADLPLGERAQFALHPSPIPPSSTSQLIAVLPLLGLRAFRDYFAVTDQVQGAELDADKRAIIDRSKPSLLALDADPRTPSTLRAKIFSVLSAMGWRDGRWLDLQLAAIALGPDEASLDERRFILLFRAQKLLASLVNDTRVRGPELEQISELLGVYRRAIDALRPRIPPEIIQQLDTTPLAIHTFAEQEEQTFISLFSLRLQAERLHRESLDKQIRVIATLAHPGNQNLALNLRYVSTPNPRGNLKALDVRILGAAHAVDRTASRTIADGFRRDLLNLLRVTLRDAYLFRLEELEASEVPQIAQPFPIGSVVELRRRVEFGVPPYVDAASAPRIYHLEGNSSLARILDMLQSQHSACMISLHLHPVALSTQEESFFRSCARPASAQPLLDDGALFFLGTETHPALRLNDVTTIRRMLNPGGMLRPSLLIRLFIVSPEPVPKLLINTIGSELWGTDTYQIDYYEPGTPSFHAICEGLRQGWIANTATSDSGPQELRRVPFLFEPYEGSRLFRLPLEGYSGAVPNLFSIIPAPAAALPEEGVEIGVGFHSGAQKALVVRLSDRERTKHTYVAGKTGTGKSTLLARMIEQDIQAGDGVCVIDPHGDLIDSILLTIPEARITDVVLLDPTSTERPFGLNLLELNPQIPHHKDLVMQDTISIMRKLFYFDHGGPIFEHNLRHLVLTMLDESMEGQGTLIEVPRPLYDESFRSAIVPKLRDELARDFWEQYREVGSARGEYIWYVVSKFDTFTIDRILRNIIGQARSTVNFREIIEDRRILLVKLPSALIGELNAALLGMIIVSKLRAAGMARAALPPTERSVYRIYVDEFQNFAASGFDTILAEARKYGLSLVLAHQHIGQLSAFNISSGAIEDRIAQAIFGNIGTMIIFRVGVRDAQFLAQELGKPVEPNDLENIKNFHAIVKTIYDGEVFPPFTIRTVRSVIKNDEEIAQAIRERSTEKYGRAQAEVEAMIAQRTRHMMES